MEEGTECPRSPEMGDTVKGGQGNQGSRQGYKCKSCARTSWPSPHSTLSQCKAAYGQVSLQAKILKADRLFLEKCHGFSAENQDNWCVRTYM